MDFHCHLDLYPNAREVFKEAAQKNEFTWLVTTSPKAFVATARVLTGAANVLNFLAAATLKSSGGTFLS